MRNYLINAAMLTAVGSLVTSGPAWSGPVADFYKDNDITILVGAGAGGGFAIASGLLRKHMPRHMPGKPGIVIQYMPGGGGQKMTNYFYNIAPRNGAVIGIMTGGIGIAQRIRKNVRFDARKFNAIGRMSKTPDVFFAMSRTGVKTLQQAKNAKLNIASAGKSSASFINAALFKNLLGYKYKIVTGYRGAGPTLLAIERGEVDGWVWVWPTIKTKYPQWIKERKINIYAQMGIERTFDLPNIPLAQELTDDAEKKAVFEFVGAKVSIGRHYTTPPEVPEDRLAALRTAFMATMKDRTFLAEAKKRSVDIEPLEGAKVQAIMNKTVNAPQAIVDIMKRATKAK